MSLTDVEPDPRERQRSNAPEGLDPVQYDLGEWSAAQRRSLSFQLDALSLPHSWDGPLLAVGAANEGQVDSLIDEMDEVRTEETEVNPDDGGHPLVAGRGRRLAGFLIDGLALGPVSIPLVQSGLRGEPRTADLVALVAVAIGAAYQILGVALWGRTLGKLVVGTRVVDEATGDRVGWWQASLRWGVAHALGLWILLPSWPGIGSLPFLYDLIVFGPVLWDPRRQGWHDRLAGTVVLGRRDGSS